MFVPSLGNFAKVYLEKKMQQRAEDLAQCEGSGPIPSSE